MTDAPRNSTLLVGGNSIAETLTSNPADPRFEWSGAVLLGRTAEGRATVELLAINHPDHVLLREALIEEGVFPPPDS
jgi:hypothetical protein